MTKFITSIVAILLAALQSYSQSLPVQAPLNNNDLPTVHLPDDLSVHFISPEPIQYVDISTKNITGDLPVKNVLRIRHNTDSLKASDPHEAVLTIIGEKFIAQYKVMIEPGLRPSAANARIDIRPEHIRPLDLTNIGLSVPELTGISYRLISRKIKHKVSKTGDFDLEASVNKISSVGDFVFLDLTYKNSTNIKFDIDQIRFKIEDKKITKATNVQSIEVSPIFTLFSSPSFKKEYRNIFVFKKFTFPGNKVLLVELSEKQISGRVIIQKINYKDILDADTIPDE